jgi:hypothetical protein
VTRRLSSSILALAALAAIPAIMALAVGARPLRADWLVTRQGERFETKGPWQVKGKLLVFTLPDGTLSSIRADKVDFDASKRAAEEAAKKAAAASVPPPPVEQRKAVIILTDKDFHSPLPAGTSADAAGSGGSGNTAGAAKTGKDAAHEGPAAVEIVSWDRLAEADSKVNGIEIVGTLRNGAQVPLVEVTLTASLFDDAGNVIARAPAKVDTSVLAPGETSQFRVAIDGVFTFSTVKWDAQWKTIKVPHEGKPAPAASAPAPATPPPAPGEANKPPV